MAGPTTSSIDIFNYTANPITTASSGATWQQISGAGGLGLTAFQADGTYGYGIGANSQMVISGADGADCEVWAIVGTVPGTGGSIDLAFGLIDTGTITTIDGYAVRITKQSGGADDTLEIYRITNLAATLLASVTQEFSNGDGFLGRRTGTTLELDYYNGSTWSNVLSTTDATYSTGGVKGMTIASSTARVDEFGGGTLSAGSAVQGRMLLLGVG